MKPWFRIVRFYPDFHMGPTIPFLVGATQVPIGRLPDSEEIAKNALRNLLKAFQESSEAMGVRIQWCNSTGAHVMTVSPFVDRFDWEPIDGCVPPDWDCLFSVLWRRYGDFISAGEYSIDAHVWHRFFPDELEKIEITLSMKD
jgi:hypothetical protein